MNRMSVRRKNATVCVGTLIFGSLLYIIFRPDTYIAKAVYQQVPMLQQYVVVNKNKTMFVRYYLPDFLWGLSLGCGLTAIFSPKIKGAIGCGAVACLCGVVWELLQLYHVTDGTADWLDAIMYLAAWGIAVLINIKE